MENKAIITAASNKFFPSLLNMLGSLNTNFPEHPDVFVYDLGLSYFFRKELKQIPWVKLIKMPEFAPFWRSCYTWKTYALSHPLAELNLYLDAGVQVLRPLDDYFSVIDKEGFLAVGQLTPLEDITPLEYRKLFPINEEYYNSQCITAGIFGFKNNSTVTPILNELYSAAVAGLALGFSIAEQHRNRGANKTPFIRNCKIFRHDTTLLSLLMRKEFKDFVIRDCAQFAGSQTDHDHPKQYLWNMRLNYTKLGYISANRLCGNPGALAYLNRFFVHAMISIKKVLRKLKGK
jgi:hypothetical protein